MVERLQGRRFIQPSGEVQRPKCLEGDLPGFLRDQLLQLRHDRRILAVADQPQCRLPRPFIGIGQPLDQLGCAQTRHIHRLDGGSRHCEP